MTSFEIVLSRFQVFDILTFLVYLFRCFDFSTKPLSIFSISIFFFRRFSLSTFYLSTSFLRNFLFRLWFFRSFDTNSFVPLLHFITSSQRLSSISDRYIDDIFITSNKSLDSINQMLDEANSFHPNIKLVRQIGASIPFLDVLIENKNGLLATSVYDKMAAEPYLVPFNSDHPRHVFQNIVESALLRALRYSSTWQTFNYERRSIQLMLLYNG